MGFQPQFNRLEAVRFVKQPTGNGGTVCSSGSQEYVRFYLSFDNGGTWQGQGLTSFSERPNEMTPTNRLELELP